ncbi:hypothetical protein, partial [Aeromonas veronii]|uniref:hypothetical protein n=1 Tax=Aeromonas veronii TaxID=654 RepID=UPI003003CC88
HAETALGTGRMTSTFECSKKWGDYPHLHLHPQVLPTTEDHRERQVARSGKTKPKGVTITVTPFFISNS